MLYFEVFYKKDEVLFCVRDYTHQKNAEKKSGSEKEVDAIFKTIPPNMTKFHLIIDMQQRHFNNFTRKRDKDEQNTRLMCILAKKLSEKTEIIELNISLTDKLERSASVSNSTFQYSTGINNESLKVFAEKFKESAITIALKFEFLCNRDDLIAFFDGLNNNSLPITELEITTRFLERSDIDTKLIPVLKKNIMLTKLKLILNTDEHGSEVAFAVATLLPSTRITELCLEGVGGFFGGGIREEGARAVVKAIKNSQTQIGVILLRNSWFYSRGVAEIQSIVTENFFRQQFAKLDALLTSKNHPEQVMKCKQRIIEYLLTHCFHFSKEVFDIILKYREEYTNLLTLFSEDQLAKFFKVIARAFYKGQLSAGDSAALELLTCVLFQQNQSLLSSTANCANESFEVYQNLIESLTKYKKSLFSWFNNTPDPSAQALLSDLKSRVAWSSHALKMIIIYHYALSMEEKEFSPDGRFQKMLLSHLSKIKEGLMYHEKNTSISKPLTVSSFEIEEKNHLLRNTNLRFRNDSSS